MRSRAPLPSARNPPRPLPASHSFPPHAADAPPHALANLLIFDTRPRPALSDAQKDPCCPSPRALGRSRQTASSFPRSRRIPSVSEKVRVKNCSRTPADVAVISPAARHPGLRSRRAFGTAIAEQSPTPDSACRIPHVGFRMSDSAPWGLRRTSKHDRRLGSHSRKARENRRVA